MLGNEENVYIVWETRFYLINDQWWNSFQEKLNSFPVAEWKEWEVPDHLGSSSLLLVPFHQQSASLKASGIATQSLFPCVIPSRVQIVTYIANILTFSDLWE